jgi:hypothetical protein
MADATNHDEIKDTLKKILDRLDKLEKEVEPKSHIEEGASTYVHIEQMTLQNLEQLTFRLDKLNIKELSGALNIGNNIGLEQKNKKKKSEEKKEKNKPEERLRFPVQESKDQEKPLEKDDQADNGGVQLNKEYSGLESNYQQKGNQMDTEMKKTSSGLRVKLHPHQGGEG